MKAIIGIDTQKAYVPALDLFARLEFEKPTVSLVHAAELRPPICLPDAHAEAEYAKVIQNVGLAALDAAADAACARHIHAETRMVFSRAADGLNAKAGAEAVDLIAVGATHCGRWSSSYLNSATCALALNGDSSLLVTKGQIPGKRHQGLKAVFAIDHSAHTDRVIDRFIKLAPSGIKSIMLLSAFEVDDDIKKVTGRNPAMLAGDVDRWLQEAFEKKSKAIAVRLEENGYAVSVTVVESSANDAIRHAMQSTHADLLIMGSIGNATEGSGHVGSIAIHQIGYEPYPILMVRV